MGSTHTPWAEVTGQIAHEFRDLRKVGQEAHLQATILEFGQLRSDMFGDVRRSAEIYGFVRPSCSLVLPDVWPNGVQYCGHGTAIYCMGPCLNGRSCSKSRAFA
jgi:hypothetical protein